MALLCLSLKGELVYSLLPASIKARLPPHAEAMEEDPKKK